MSRLVALAREAILGAYLGTRMGGDAFGAALRIPKVLQNLLGEGSLSASFIPVYSELLEEGDKKKANSAAGAVLGLLVGLVGLLTLATIFLAKPLTIVLTPGFSGERYDLTVTLIRIMAPGIGFIVLAAWCLGILNAHRRFFLSYVAPALWSLAIVVIVAIAAIMNLSETEIAEAAGWGVLIGGFLQFVVQIPSVLKLTGRLRITLNLRLKAVREVISRFGPALAGRGVVTLGSYLDLILASILATGAIAILDRAQALYLVPISVFALSVAAADLPEISRERHSLNMVRERLIVSTERIIFFLLLISILFISSGYVIVSAIYERINFTADDTLVVWLTLVAYTLGVIPAGISRLLQNTAYGLGDVKNPARIALFRMIFSVVCGIILMLQFDRIGTLDGSWYQTGNVPSFTTEAATTIAGIELRHLGAVGLGLGSMLGAWVELGMLRRLINRHLTRSVSYRKTIYRLLPAALISGVAGALLSFATLRLPGLAAAPLVCGPVVAIFVLMAGKSGSPQAQDLLRPIRKIIWRN